MDRKNKIALILAALILTSCDRASREGKPIESPSEEVFKTSQNKLESTPIEEKFNAVFLVSDVAKCLEVKASDYAFPLETSELHSWDCSSQKSSQQWFYNIETSEILSSNGQCLDSGEPFEEGFEVRAAICDGTISQSWTLESGTSVIHNRVYPGLCLDIWDNKIHLNGKSIQLWPCNSKANQRWTITPLPPQRIENTFISDTLLSADTLNGAVKLTNIAKVEASTQTQWLLEPNGLHYRIRSEFSPRSFLHVQHGELELGNIEFYWHSAQWQLIPQTLEEQNGYYIRNYWASDFYIGLDADNNVVAAPFSELVDGSAFWILHDLNSN